MKKSVFRNFVLYVVAILLVMVISSIVSDMVSKIKEKNNESYGTAETIETVGTIKTQLNENDPYSETEHLEENKIGIGIYKTLFSPKKILIYQLPFLAAVNVDAKSDEMEKSIFKKNKDSEIITNIQGLDNSEMVNINLSGEGPNILIYHTHTTESFRMSIDNEYRETTTWRTGDENYNVVGLGSLLTKTLASKYGYNIIHDKSNHEPPKLSTSYSRSLKTMEQYKREYQDLEVYIDIHRDAADVVNDRDDVVLIDGKRCAKIMFVVGIGVDFNDKPNWEENYKLALAITNELNDIENGLAKPIRLKDGRYNQHITDACILIEVGHNANTYEEAKNTIEYLAKAINNVLK